MSGGPTLVHRTLVVVLSAALAMLGVALNAPRASAADIPTAVTSITVTPSPAVGAWDTLTTSIEWCVPDGTQPGDTFTVGLPDLLGSWPASFPLTSRDGVQVATGSVNPGPPSYLVVTFDAAVSGKSNVCGTATLESQVRNASSVVGTSQTLTYTASARNFSTVVNFDPMTPVPNARKWGGFTGTDQCRTSGTDCLVFGIETGLGPISGDVVITDTATSGMAFDCASMSLYWADQYASYVRGLSANRYTVNSCTTGAFKVTIHGVLDALKATIIIYASAPPSSAGGITYTNTATITSAGTPQNVSTSVVSNVATGTAVGSAINITKDDVQGNAADTPDTRVLLPDGSTGIVVTLTNQGLDALINVVVSDTTISGTGAVSGLTCDFSKAVAGAPTTGVTWDGPWPVNTTFTCTGTLAGVTPVGHADVATVIGYDASGKPVRGRNPYYATRPVVSIGDHVWWDNNRDGLQDAGEPPVVGATVQLLGADGTVLGVQKTDANGFYSFIGLPSDTAYTVKFIAPSGATFTRAVAGSNRAVDSNPNAAGLAPVTTPASGNNSPTAPDNPTIDAGLVKFNLALAKTLVTKGPFAPGQTITYTLTPRNDGPSAALAGWSVVDLPPSGMTITSMSGIGYTCTVATRTCVSASALPKGVAKPITVVARLGAAAAGVQHNVAYVKPAAGDVVETNPLGTPPTTATNTDKTTTDNDAQASLTLTPKTYTYVVQADQYRPVIAGKASASATNKALIASLDDDGVLRHREDMGTACNVKNSPTCMWYHTTHAFVTVKVVAYTTPTAAQIMAAYNKVAPASVGKVTTTARMGTISGTTNVVWILGANATTAAPFGGKGTIPQRFLAHS